MPANPLRGEVDLVVGEATHRLIYDVNAFIYAEEALGLTTDEIVKEFWGYLDASNLRLIRALLWAGMQAENPSSLLEAGQIIGEAGVGPVKTAIMKGLAEAFGIAEGKEDANPPKHSRGGTGSPSTKTGAKRATTKTRSGAVPRD